MPTYIFAVYDEETGEITGRIRTNQAWQLDQYPNRIEITPEDSANQVEKTHKVDVAHLKVHGQKRLKAKDKDKD